MQASYTKLFFPDAFPQMSQQTHCLNQITILFVLLAVKTVFGNICLRLRNVC